MTPSPPSNWDEARESSVDSLPPAMVHRIAATFNRIAPQVGGYLPPLWHWAFFQQPASSTELGKDGHPKGGKFLPPMEGLNRMWAGGRLEFLSPLSVGNSAERQSTIADVKEKRGQSGFLKLVTVRHSYYQQGELCIREEQDIVYREATQPKLSLDMDLPTPEWSETIQPTPTMLFRYSACTFNSHRIHYDWPYATETEGYPDLVVHGPMIATLMLQAFCNANPGNTPVRFSFRGLRPLFANENFQVAGRRVESGKAELWAFNRNGPAHRAEVEYRNSY